jgi:hypothetical protein
MSHINVPNPRYESRITFPAGSRLMTPFSPKESEAVVLDPDSYQMLISRGMQETLQKPDNFLAPNNTGIAHYNTTNNFFSSKSNFIESNREVKVQIIRKKLDRFKKVLKEDRHLFK